MRVRTTRLVASIADILTRRAGAAFAAQGLPESLGRVVESGRPDLAPYQCNGAMAGASTASSSAPETWTERVKFAHGKSSAEFEEQMFAGGAGRYVLGAKNGQFLEVDIRAFGPDVYYRIISPDKSSLLDPIISDKPYKGQLWQSGDHVVEVINRGDKDVGFQIRISIE